MAFVEHLESGVAFLSAGNIGCVHAFTTRLGGVSSGVYESLNLGINSGDDIVYVRKNYDIICQTLGISCDNLVCNRQVHGSYVRVVTREDCGKLFLHESPQCDAMITNTPGAALIVYTADCVPILLHDPVVGAVAAIHSGWRGTAQNIVGEALRKMTVEFGCQPSQIKAAIGPSISKCCYETDADVADALRKTLSQSAQACISKQGNKYMLDLKEANRLLLSKAGVDDISVSDECTSCQSDKYWSHRKTKGPRGTQAAVIIRNEELGIRN